MLMKKEVIEDNKKLKEENIKLKALCDKYEEEHKTVFEEWKKTINIINELEIWLINEMKFQEIVERDYGFRKSYYKLQELKGVDKE